MQENNEGGKSSAIQHTNNTVLSEALVALVKLNATLQSHQLQSLLHVTERVDTAWILEWNAIPKMKINTGAALNHAISISLSIEVNADAMWQNIEQIEK